MRRFLGRLARGTWRAVFSTDQTKAVILRLAWWKEIDLLTLAYNERGIAKCDAMVTTSETFFIKSVLPRLVDVTTPVLLDVGANTGLYSLLLRSAFPGALIHSFEPNPHTFSVLRDSVSADDIQCHSVGLGSSEGPGQLYTYSADLTSGHASSLEAVFTDLHHSTNNSLIQFRRGTLDAFCRENGIDEIDFLKIDTEGSELDVLRGATDMLSRGKIRVVQFEFNEMNVVSRTFLRDYYRILPGFHFWRLDTKKLVPLPAYSVMDEVFVFQNVLAVDDQANEQLGAMARAEFRPLRPEHTPA